LTIVISGDIILRW